MGDNQLEEEWFQNADLGLDLDIVSSSQEGRNALYERFFDEQGVFKLSKTSPLYYKLRIHHFFRGESVLVNGREAVYGDGKEGLSYYYLNDKERKKRVRFRTGDQILTVVEVQEVRFLSDLRDWFSRQFSSLIQKE